ncbi:MAG: hypothetical protein ABIO39_12050 [Caulobacteraceae bacterium]
MRWALGALSIALLTADGAAAKAPSCYPVHGRLFAANGTPSLRIWPVGTRRILGVHDDAAPDALPLELRGEGAPSMAASDGAGDRVVYGDFTVCPLARDRRGHMRMVTVKAVKHPVRVREKDR